ncbi:MAG: dihydropteroate synthase [Bacteroidaceae bacterium]|nr:dihydropteroate synthase [Bacteroidaceae bacterium]
MNTYRSEPYALNLGGRLIPLDRPLVMGILNVTAESFYEASQVHTAEAIARRARAIVSEGGAIIDIGACSTKPGLAPVSEEEELRRLEWALPIIRASVPDAILSVDTFRASVAERCVKEHGVHIVNDISGGKMDEHMYDTVARLGVPYILTHHGSVVWQEMMYDLAERINRLHLMGMNDIIVDPGFGFGKTIEENYRLMAHLEELHLLECPLLVGVSRKSMIYNLLDCTPDEALNGTTALHTVALTKGAHILRVHDVKTAVEAITIVKKIHNS